MIIEIVVFNIESAIQAQVGGANRIELCDNPSEGGTTPSVGVIEQAKKNLSINVFVMVRPRGGDFCYSDHEFGAMKRDIEVCKQLKVDGVVFGILTSDGRIDMERNKELIELARPMKVTCHRAFDMTRDPLRALEDCISVGFDRILTSGQKPQAIQGIDLITQLNQQANGRIVIMPGSGVNEENIATLVSKTGVKEIHFSARRYITSKNPKHNDLIRFTDALKDDWGSWVTDASVVRRMRGIAEK
ncbi:MAG TPA: copper homeostasis protein CutC [Cyclobacteriaceae bacterium]|nr:copper homeostasis protein CutC [Cyclobacteriaceae bacterium]